MNRDCSAQGLALSKHTTLIHFYYYLLFILAGITHQSYHCDQTLFVLWASASDRNRMRYYPQQANSEYLCLLRKEGFVSRRKRRGEWDGRND